MKHTIIRKLKKSNQIQRIGMEILLRKYLHQKRKKKSIQFKEINCRVDRNKYSMLNQNLTRVEQSNKYLRKL
jgi:hypothetical protein